MKYIAIIPARAGSKGLVDKNIKILAGKPLIAWSIQQALDVDRIDCVHVSTNDTQIADIARAYGADVPYLRPNELAQDTSPTEPSISYALDWYAQAGKTFDAIILLQPTSPLRLPGTLAGALASFEEFSAGSLLGVSENHHFFWRNSPAPTALYNYENRPRRQDIVPKDRLFRENGSIYITRTSLFNENHNRLCKPIQLYLMRDEEGWEIDSLADFVVVEALMKLKGQM